MSVTPDANVARIIAEQLAGILARGMDSEPPEVAQIAVGAAQFSMDTPLGRIRVDIRMID